jgi:hypothetical protein
MRTIPFIENFPGLFKADKNINWIWENYPYINSNIQKPGIAVFHSYGVAYFSPGCGSFGDPDYFSREFIRDHQDCPCVY